VAVDAPVVAPPDRFIQSAAIEEPIDRQPADRDDEPGLEDRDFALDEWKAIADFLGTGSAVAAARGLPRETAHDGGHVHAGAEGTLVDAMRRKPSEEGAPRRPGEGMSRNRLVRSRGLPDEQDPRSRRGSHDRRSEDSRTAAAGADLGDVSGVVEIALVVTAAVGNGMLAESERPERSLFLHGPSTLSEANASRHRHDRIDRSIQESCTLSEPTDRLAKMLAYVASRPDEAFPRYGLAMEYVKLGRLDDAHSQFQELRRRHPDYVATYYHHGKLLVRMGRAADARRTWEEGMRVSAAKGDLHARDEIQAALMELAAQAGPPS
jgi:hypothetical protein